MNERCGPTGAGNGVASFGSMPRSTALLSMWLISRETRLVLSFGYCPSSTYDDIQD